MHADDPGDHWTAKRALAHGIGQTRGSRNSKVHAICDALERPHVLMITPGNVHDMRVAKQCIATMPPSAELVGDKGYCSNELWAWLAERGTQAVILNKRNRRVHHKFNPAIYKQRNVVERMFCRFKDWHRVAIRFDRNVKKLHGYHRYRCYCHLVTQMRPDPNCVYTSSFITFHFTFQSSIFSIICTSLFSY